jgi:cyclic beta-1,2-glucan synthetase
MATTYQSPSDLQLVFPLPKVPNTVKPDDDCTQPDAGNAAPVDSFVQSRFAVLNTPGWEIVRHCDSFKPLESERKRIAGRIDAAAEALRSFIATGKTLTGDARILSDSLSDIQLALLEARSGIESARKLPHVKLPGAEQPVPRSHALSGHYLQAVQCSFEESDFADFMTDIQRNVPLRMDEVWSFKAFLEFGLLREISNALATISLDEFVDSDDLSGPATVGPSRLAILLESLQRISGLNWKLFFESISQTEQILRTDPQGAYERMDFETREEYRSVVADLAARSECTETEVARQAIALARASHEIGLSHWTAARKSHVGYYLVDKGQPDLQKSIGYRASLGRRFQESVRRRSDYTYLMGIEVIALAAVILLITISHAQTLGVLAVALFLVPAVECAVATMNLLVTALFPPKRLARLDFSAGIPRDCSTVVVVPTLLTSEEQVRRAVQALEIRFLANRDANLHFALLSDPPDSIQPFDEKDALAPLCSQLVEQLNDKYARDGKGSFSHLHRHRVYNSSEELWMGWERKRGKLLDFNRFLLGQGDPFPVKAGNAAALAGIRYVITLDLDTQLPRDVGRRLVATLAHPLNRAVIDPGSNTVVEGYGILQPRVDISIRSASRSRFASLLSGDTGFDVYTRAVSDVYQDLFGEGIFTGKGIYEVRTFQTVLEHRFPNNAILSHDLIEGEYARTGLVSDIEVVDDYPSHLSAYSRRRHRWMRGDWQIIFALLPFVRNSFGEIVRNPLSHISRWKIIDNLRRSLTDFTIFLLLLCGWFYPPPVNLYWTRAALAILLFPTYFRFLFAIIGGGKALFSRAFWTNLAADFVGAHATLLFKLAFLCHQSLVAVDAIVRTLVRMTLTRKKMLEWETASDAEQDGQEGNDRAHPVDAYLSWTFPFSFAIAALLAVLQPSSLWIAAPFLVLWGLSSVICKWLNQPQQPANNPQMSPEEARLVRNMALRTWQFFREFSTHKENWLIPDIVRETPRLVAHHVSPTNLGLLLNSRLAAHDFGFTSLREFIRDTERTLDTFERMPKFRGHLYNWYATESLKPVEPLFVSTVDNGNLLCCLWTLKQGCLETVSQPLFRPALWQGILDHVDLLLELLAGEKNHRQIISAARQFRRRVAALAGPNLMRFDGISDLETDFAIFNCALLGSETSEEILFWARELSERVANLAEFIWSFAPWLDRRLAKPFVGALSAPALESLTLDSAPAASRRLLGEVDVLTHNAGASSAPQSCAVRLGEALENALRVSAETKDRLSSLAARTELLIDEMNFGFLYNPNKRMLSIGYDAGEGRLSKCHYDLLASEARAAVFGAIAKNDIPQESWFELRRQYARYGRNHVLRSWTGTAFEYLMPGLWFRTYPNTLLEHGASSCVRAQQHFARKHNIPWGISESSCSDVLPDGHYRYHAFGIPGMALNRDDSSGDLVVSPYSTFLALQVDTRDALKNLRKMKKLGWLSSFGFYEAADFTPSRVADGKRSELVFNWMAHHQGMILVAAANALCDSAMQRRFNAEPCVAATERILHEKRPRVIVVEKESERIREHAPIFAGHLGEAMQHPEFRDLAPGLS